LITSCTSHTKHKVRRVLSRPKELRCTPKHPCDKTKTKGQVPNEARSLKLTFKSSKNKSKSSSHCKSSEERPDLKNKPVKKPPLNLIIKTGTNNGSKTMVS
jgi:hypothetical protein